MYSVESGKMSKYFELWYLGIGNIVFVILIHTGLQFVGHNAEYGTSFLLFAIFRRYVFSRKRKEVRVFQTSKAKHVMSLSLSNAL